MQLSEFDYPLDEKMIAQRPVEPRDHSKLLLCQAKGSLGQFESAFLFEHKKFFEIENEISENDFLVFNNAKVLPSRLLGKRQGGTGKVEALLCRRSDQLSDQKNPNRWVSLLRMSAPAKVGLILEFEPDLKARVLTSSEERYQREGEMDLEFFGKALEENTFEQWLTLHGHVPLPPYVGRSDEGVDKSTYQTVYATQTGSAAAPTAGFHFTETLISKLKDKKVQQEFITLHVGIGTFRPIKTEKIEDHQMHEEVFEITAAFASAYAKAKSNRKNVVAVGTTVLRTLESWVRACKEKGIEPGSEKSSGVFQTRIFIKPGFQFQAVHSLITNFHLPKSSLLVLVAAAMGVENYKKAYALALENDYRFFSYGDAMFIRGVEK